MKIQFNIYKTFAACFFIAGLSFSSCKKKTEPMTPVPETPANGTVFLHLHTNLDTNEVDTYNHNYVLTGGRRISVSVAQLYISGIQLIKSDNSVVDLSGTTVLKLMELEQYLAGSVAPGNYKSIRFNVGLSAATNSTSPAIADSTLNRPNMWFGASAQPSGYVFVNLQGKIDTSAVPNATATMQSFVYKIGTNAHLKTIVMPDQNYTVTSSQAQYIHIIIDYYKLFNSITLNNAANLSVNSVSDNSGALSNTIANNIQLMFSYEQL